MAFKDGDLAADTLATNGGTVTGHFTKVQRLADGRLAALLGRHGHAMRLLKWIEAPGDAEQPEGDCAVVVVSADGVRCYEDGSVEHSSDAPFKAFGSGGDIALGAMAAGASAEEAVRIACDWDTCTGGAITVLRLET